MWEKVLLEIKIGELLIYIEYLVLCDWVRFEKMSINKVKNYELGFREFYY